MDEDELFNPDYVEVDRVIDMKTSTDVTTGEETTLYLVKWRSLSYDECTWELAQDIDTEKIQAFLHVKDLPPENERKVRNYCVLFSFLLHVTDQCCNFTPREVSSERLKLQTSNFVHSLATRSTNLHMTNCPPNGSVKVT